MKKLNLIILVLILSLSLFGCSKGHIPNPPAQNEQQEKHTVETVVIDFGQKLQMVSLLAPADQVRESMQDNYANLITPALLDQWQNAPQTAPGRQVSSPWPDRINVLSTEKADSRYTVNGEIIYVTSVEKANGGVASKQSINLGLGKYDNNWLIESVTLGPRIEEGMILYQNSEYGFHFRLPASWHGYTIIKDKWNGLAVAGSSSGTIIAVGPILSIRHPQWTAQNPRQDIPIMIFTPEQWKALQKEEMSVGAAPIPPKELAHNAQYVFALPARYNYAFPAGFEEVEQILASNPLQAY